MPSSSLQEAFRYPVRLVRGLIDALALHPPHVTVGPAVGARSISLLPCFGRQLTRPSAVVAAFAGGLPDAHLA